MDEANTIPSQIATLRHELKLTQRQFAVRIGVKSAGNVSIIERTGECSLDVALKIERLAAGIGMHIDAANLNAKVRRAREGVCCDHARRSIPQPVEHAAGNDSDFSPARAAHG